MRRIIPVLPFLLVSAASVGSANEPERRARYEQQAIRFDSEADRKFLEVDYGETSRAYQGQAGAPLDMYHFLHAVGEPEWAERYRSRRRYKIGLAVAGSVLAAVGGALLVTDLALGQRTGPLSDFYGDGPCYDAMVTDCHLRARTEYRTDYRLTGTGIGLLVMACAGWITAAVLPKGGASASEARDLTERYNRDLRRRLGLSETASSPSPKPPGLRMILAPVLSPTGGGMELSARF